jgi:hypothetical protein
MEYNLATDRFGLWTPETTTDCASGSGPNDCAISGSYRGRNYFGAATAPTAWDNVQLPDSMFLTAAPDWWCQEACEWDAQEGIGALGSSTCKLPAQIRYEAGQCTALAAEAPATHSMGGGSMSGGSWGGP